MKTGLGLYQKYRMLYAYFNLLRFGIKKALLGFDVANIFIQRVDKYSLRLILKKNGAKIGRDCDIETGQIFHNCKNYSNLSIGNNCHIGKNCFFDLRDRITIGDNVVISMLTTIITHQDLNKTKLRTVYPSLNGGVIIESDCYIGVRSVILYGVVIEDFSVVAAGSVVLKRVDSKTLVGGVPARFIKQLFSEG